MRVGSVEVEGIDLLQLGDLADRIAAEGRLPLKGMKNDPLEQVAESHIVNLGQSLENLEDALLQADAGLDALDVIRHGSLYHGTNVPNRRMCRTQN